MGYSGYFPFTKHGGLQMPMTGAFSLCGFVDLLAMSLPDMSQLIHGVLMPHVVLAVSILAIMLNCFGAWRPKRPKHKEEPAGTRMEHLLIVLTGAIAIFSALLSGSDWFALHFSHKPTVLVTTKDQRALSMPDCLVGGIDIDTQAESIKSLGMVILFPHEIHDYVVLNVRDGESLRTRVSWPCEIQAKSTDRDNALTFTVSADRREVIIRGREFTHYDRQHIIVTFYPDHIKWDDLRSGLDWNGESTYSAFGRELPATIRWKAE
jgi:hypothetical protein